MHQKRDTYDKILPVLMGEFIRCGQIGLRPLLNEDIPQLGEIEKEAFPTVWPPTPFERELKNTVARYLTTWSPKRDDVFDESFVYADSHNSPWVGMRFLNKIKQVLSIFQKTISVNYNILGYVGLWFMSEEAHITSIAVRKGWRGYGIGELLLIGAIDTAIDNGSNVVSLEVRVSNVVAQRLYEKYGFNRVGTRHRYYHDNSEDAAIMTTDPIGMDSYKERFNDLKSEFSARHHEVATKLQ